MRVLPRRIWARWPKANSADALWPSSWMATGAGPRNAICRAVEGHRNGVESVRAVVRASGELGIKFLTLYAFSVENWNRPKDEVDMLMKYLARFLKSEIGELNRNNVRLEVIGQIYRLPEFVQEQLEKTQTALSKNNGLTLVLALSYGGRTEIVDAARSIAAKVKEGRMDAGGNHHAGVCPVSLHP